MKGCVISVLNKTDFTPEITSAILANCAWVNHFEINPPKPIANHQRVVGWVEGMPDYSITLRIHYYLYNEAVSARINVNADNTVDIICTHSEHLLINAFWVIEEGNFMVFLELETWDQQAARHPEAFQALGGNEDHLIVRAGDVTKLIAAIEKEGGKAHQISVNRSLKPVKKITDQLLDQLTKSEIFHKQKEIAVGWQNKIEQKAGLVRIDALPDNKYHALLDNLEAKFVSGLFQNYPNPNYTGEGEED